MQSTSTVHGLPFAKKPRNGQQRVFDEVAKTNSKSLNIKLPTGYGKTNAACGSYSILKRQGKVNRLLFIFPTDAQLEQFRLDGSSDLQDVAVDGPKEVIDIRFWNQNAIKKHRKNAAQVFAITVQSLIATRGESLVHTLLETGDWMIVVDEYHHYGLEAAWGRSVLALNKIFLLAMSATPNRPEDDSAFGDPEISVTYEEAVREGAVKPLVAHSYIYRLDAIDANNEIVSFTTDDLITAAGGDSPTDIEKFRVTSNMRWSPKYVSPLVRIPIERLITESVKTGYPLQAIIGAMCVSHAKLVYDQVKSMFGDVLTVDWVGTGPDGRSDAENKAVLAKFCPKKDEDGNRKPTIDVLIHVGMAGEGLDSIYVSEVSHLNRASKSNSNDQENGRAGRYLRGVTGYINFDSCSEYAELGYVGKEIMKAMDDAPPSIEDEDDPSEKSDPTEEFNELPEEPEIRIYNVELESINSGMIGVQRMAEVMKEASVGGVDYKALNDLDNPEWEKINKMYHNKLTLDARKFDSQSVVAQWQQAVKKATSVATGTAIKIMNNMGRIQASLPGDLKKRINGRKKRECGPVTEDIDVLRTHYSWLTDLNSRLIAGEMPQWLL